MEKRRILSALAGMFCGFCCAGVPGFSQGVLENARYRLDVSDSGVVTLQTSGQPAQTLQPEFTVIFSAEDPGYHVNHQNYLLAPRTSARWTAFDEDLDSLNQRLAMPALRAWRGNDVIITAKDDGARTWIYRDDKGKTLLQVTGPYARGTTDPLLAGQCTIVKALRGRVEGRTLRWEFPSQEAFAFSAELTLAEGDTDLRISHRIEAKTPGWYSVGFTGAPSLSQDRVQSLPQECAGRGYRQFNHLVNEAFLRLPRIHLATREGNSALVVDSGEMPFRIPTRANARFGMMLQWREGRFQPMAFAPILGGAESRLKTGDVRTFAVHYLVRPGDWKDTYAYIARTFYAFRDQRDNTGSGSLNQALEATLDFLSDRRGGNRALWHAEQKYYDYWTDNSGIFKPFSPLFGLSAAVVTDDEAFYRTRALPQIEFALSRANNTFAPYEVAQNGQVKSRNRELGRSYLPAAQLVHLSAFLQHRTPSIVNTPSAVPFSSNRFIDLLAKYELTRDPKDLDAARVRADEELTRRKPTGEGDDYMDWLELHEITRDPRYLAAALEGAYGLTTTINLSPATPDKTLTADAGNKVGVHEHSVGRHRLWGFLPPQSVPANEQVVPAWRVSLTGLQSPAYRGELWMNHHGQLMRLAGLARDDFLRDIARWGMVGRFGNYPGDNRSNFSLVTESADAVEAPVWQWNFATVNPGHAWEFVGELIDFLVSDAFHRSQGQIDFPGRPMPGTSFRVRAYGDRPGKFYDETNVRLWLPRHLLSVGNRQVDYLAGYGNGQLYLAFWNQSTTRQAVQVNIDPSRADLTAARNAKTWIDGTPAATTRIDGQTLSFHVAPKGITAFAIAGATVRPGLQAKMFDSPPLVLGKDSFTRVKASFGQVCAQLISAGRNLTQAFVYTDALPDQTISAQLRYRQGTGPWHEMTDEIFPYEFSLPYHEDAGALELEFIVESASQKIEKTPIITLRP